MKRPMFWRGVRYFALMGESGRGRGTECGGTFARVPARRGFGSRLLSRQAGLERVEIEFRPEGLLPAQRRWRDVTRLGFIPSPHKGHEHRRECQSIAAGGCVRPFYDRVAIHEG
jgi:hypothetical protein